MPFNNKFILDVRAQIDSYTKDPEKSTLERAKTAFSKVTGAQTKELNIAKCNVIIQGINKIERETPSKDKDSEWIKLIVLLGQTADEIQNGTANAVSTCAEMLHFIRLSMLHEIEKQKADNEAMDKKSDALHTLPQALKQRILEESSKLDAQNELHLNARSGTQSTRAHVKEIEHKQLELVKALAYLGELKPFETKTYEQTKKLYPKQKMLAGVPVGSGYEYSHEENSKYGIPFSSTMPLVLQHNFRNYYALKYKKSFEAKADELVVIDSAEIPQEDAARTPSSTMQTLSTLTATGVKPAAAAAPAAGAPTAGTAVDNESSNDEEDAENEPAAAPPKSRWRWF